MATVQLVLVTVVLLSYVHSELTQNDLEAISAAVLEALMPVLNEGVEAIKRDLEEHKLYVNRTVSQRMNETRSGVEAIRRDLSNLEDNMNRNKDDLGQRLDRVEDRLVDMNKKILATQSVVERSLNESMTTVNEECLTDHLTRICDKMDRINSRIISVSSAINGTIDSKLDILDSKQDKLDIKVMSVNSELEQTILTNITKQLKKTSESSHEALGSCGGEGWTRVAYLDMTDPNTTCPSGWQLTGHSKRTCGKVSSAFLTCDSVFFPVSGGAYTSVCGRIKGYQNSRTDAFEVYHNGDATTIEEPYVSGVSLTHGSPRQHIWTFAASATSSYTNIEACPCNSTTHRTTPPFVGGDYFCESGVNSGSPRGFFPDDPLWDGDSCAVSSLCCPFNNPPYFTKQLSNATTDDLEVRLCWWDNEDETPIELIELYAAFGELNTKEPHHNVLINTQQLTDMISSKMELINVSMREEFRAVERQFQEHKNQTTSELSDLHTSLQSTIHSPPTEAMSDAVLYKLLPYINKLNASVRGMRHQIQEHKNWTFDMHTSLQSSISAHVNQQSEICDKTDIIGSKMDRINVSLREEFEAMKQNFEEHKNQTISELSDLHTSLQSTHADHLTQICDKMDVLNSRMINVSSANNGTIDSKLDLLDSKQDELDMKVMSINTQLEHNILTNITKQLQKTSESSHEALGPCGGEGWRRVAYLDMTDPNTNCPSGWQLGTRGSKRTCDRFSTGSLTCDSVFFPVSGGAYTTVCGRIRAYQYSSTDAFESYHDGQATTIDEAYVSGVSLTHGSPRQHIWTFAAGITEAYRNQEDACPCDDTVAISIPPFVGEDYFCESGDHSGSETWGGFHLYDPLWDGQNCTSTSTCCSFNNPPYFTKRLPSPTTDDLEARLCLLDSGNDAPIEFIELYVGLGEVNTKALHQNVLSNTQKLTHMISSKMELINVSMREEFRAVERQFQEHKNQTASELSDLHTSLQSTHTDHLTQICAKMDGINLRIISVSSANNSTIDSKLDLLDSKQDELNRKVMSVNSELEHNILTNITKQLQKTSESLHEALGPCGGEGWTRVAYLDMTDPNTTCPSGWQLITRDSKRTCNRFSTGSLTCDSVVFPVSGGAYTTVCGRIRAYQYSSTDAFESYHDGDATTIDEAYVSGVSLTHGSPRQHIWTFAAGITEVYHTRKDACPCDATVAISIPPFVGEDYFCESGVHSRGGSGGFHPYDPLWDGQNCTSTSTCCSFNNPPYFTKRLPNPTTDDLEVRLCLYDSGEDAPIEFIELYVGLDEQVLYQNVLSNTQKLTDMISSKTELINVSMREEFRAVERQFQEHKNQTTSELSDLHTSLQSTHTDHLTQISAKMDVIDSRLVSISSAINDSDLQEAEQNILTNVTKETQKMSNSLHEVMEELEHHVHEDLGEFERDVLSNVTTQINDLAENNDLHNYVCGSTGGWTRAIYLDMTDPNTDCPSGWHLNTHWYSERVCYPYNRFFPVSGGAYNRVCGRVTAYQYSFGQAFNLYHTGRATTIDDRYVDGVSLTHGSPRQHIWTFASGISEASPTSYSSCPCDASVEISVPLFVGGDYFCESGVNSVGPIASVFHSDPLWDGKNCTNSSRCCSFNNPPYFTKRLSSATTDDIELRILKHNFLGSFSSIALLEIYTKLDVVDVEEVEQYVVSGVREELKTTYDSLQEDHGRMNVHVCGGTGGWRHAAYLDMTDPNTNCPSGWLPGRYSKRTCGKVSTGSLTCDSVFFPVSGGTYTRVCGRIKGYQYGHTDAFESYHKRRATTIDSAYVTGVSLTHGTPQQHIWTFAASPISTSTNDEACPCNSTTHRITPSFVGQNYFCESGNNPGSTGSFYVDDPLWDGDICAVSSTCCPFNNPPYFTKRLSSATTDDLEVRLCRMDGGDDTPIEFMELYIK